MSDYIVEVLVNGRPVRKFEHDGSTFIEGRKKSKFELKFINNTWNRLEIIPSVDGLSTINGEPCGPESEGYICEARSSIVIPGWRIDNESIAEFMFNDKEHSYVSEVTDEQTQAGSIGFMVFEEKKKSTDLNSEYNTRRITTIGAPYIWNGAPNSNAPQWTSISLQNSANMNEPFSLGTDWGNQQQHKVSIVEFERNAPEPDHLSVIYYDTLRGLEARGIEVIKKRKEYATGMPNPFPMYNNPGCKPPNNWKSKK